MGSTNLNPPLAKHNNQKSLYVVIQPQLANLISVSHSGLSLHSFIRN